MALIAEFDATIDDFVDITLRAMPRSQVPGSFNQRIILMTALAVAILTFAAVDESLAARFGAAFIPVLIGIVGYALTRKSYRYRERQLRRRRREQMGPGESVRVRVELTESGVTLDQQQVRSIYDWSSITEIQETEDAIYFYPLGGDLFAVRKRAFESIDKQNEFLQMARHYVELNWSDMTTREHWLPIAKKTGGEA